MGFNKSKTKPIFLDPSGRRQRWILLLLAVTLLGFAALLNWQFSRLARLQSWSVSIQQHDFATHLEPASDIAFTAFLYPNDSQARLSLRENLSKLSQLSVLQLSFGPDTQLLELPETARILKHQQALYETLPVYLLLDAHDYSSSGKRTGSLNSLWTDLISAGVRDSLIPELITWLQQQDYQGISLDLPWQWIPATHIAQVSDWLAELAQALRAADLSLQVVTDAMGHQLWHKLLSLQDSLILRLFKGYPEADTLPFISLEATKQHLAALNLAYPALRFQVMLASQTLQLSPEGTVTELDYHALESFLTVGTHLRAHETTGVFHLALPEGNTLYISDALTWHWWWQEVLFPYQHQLTGLVWSRLGAADPTTWLAFQHLQAEKQLEIITSHLQFSYEVDIAGEGEIYTLIQTTQPGSRRVHFAREMQQELVDWPVRGKVQRSGYAKGSIQLSFDDGPHPRHTNRILDILQEQQVKATFFIIGENALRYPQVLLRIWREGHDIGNHSFLHNNPYYLSDKAFLADLLTTQEIIETIVGVRPALYRPPYMTPYGFATSGELARFALLMEHGYQVAFADIGGNDWLFDSNDEIYQQIVSQLEQATTASDILLHDIQANAVAILPQLIDHLRQEGWQLSALQPRSEIKAWQRVLDNPIGLTAQTISLLARLYMVAFFTYTMLLSTLLIVLYIRSQRSRKLPDFDVPVTVVIPCFNEAKVIAKTLKSILTSNYARFEVIVIDDGSTDATWDVLQNFSQDPRSALISAKQWGQGSSPELWYSASKP